MAKKSTKRKNSPVIKRGAVSASKSAARKKAPPKRRKSKIQALRGQVAALNLKLPKVRSDKGYFRALTEKEIRQFLQTAENLPEAGMPLDKFGGQFTRMQEHWHEVERKAKKSRKHISGKQIREVEGIIPKIKKRDGYRYIQAGSAPNFVLGEKSLNRKLIVRRNGKETVIDTPEKEKNLIQAIKKARSMYRAKLRKMSKEGLKISDVMFIAAKREAGATIIDIDAIEYGGLTTEAAKQSKLK